MAPHNVVNISLPVYGAAAWPTGLLGAALGKCFSCSQTAQLNKAAGMASCRQQLDNAMHGPVKMLG